MCKISNFQLLFFVVYDRLLKCFLVFGLLALKMFPQGTDSLIIKTVDTCTFSVRSLTEVRIGISLGRELTVSDESSMLSNDRTDHSYCKSNVCLLRQTEGPCRGRVT